MTFDKITFSNKERFLLCKAYSIAYQLIKNNFEKYNQLYELLKTKQTLFEKDLIQILGDRKIIYTTCRDIIGDTSFLI